MTHTNRPNLAADLLDLDTRTDAGRAAYDRALESLFDRKLTRADWLRLSLMGIGGLAGATICGLLAATEPASLPARTRVAFIVLAAIGLTWASLAGLIIRRGSVHAPTHGTLAATLGFAFSLLTTAAISILSLTSPHPTPTPLLLLPLATLSLATAVLITHHIKLAELRLRRDLLESEYRLSRRPLNPEP